MRDRYSPRQYEHPGTQKELEYLDDLIEAFGVDQEIEPAGALKRIFDRWRSLLSNLVEIGNSIRDRVEEGRDLHELLRERVRKVHHLLFDEILENAGEYRQVGDTGGHRVHFGGRKKQTLQPKYSGVHPDEIEEGLDSAFEHLDYQPDASKEVVVRSLALFYGKFIRVHPFYDANGRIARFISSVYLYVNGYYLDWERVYSKKNEFIRRLNKHHNTHDDLDTNVSERYLNILVSFLIDRTEEHSSFYDPGTEEINAES